MTTTKQFNANKANSEKSTGPTTPVGKAKASKNAIRHGLLSARLLLSDEDPGEFQDLKDDLIASLRAIGALELALVERIAVSLWRQQRLIRAETAGIELFRRPSKIRHQVGSALEICYPEEITAAELEPSANGEKASASFYQDIIDEWSTVNQDPFKCDHLGWLSTQAPTLFSQLKADAKRNGMSLASFVLQFDGGLSSWAKKMAALCQSALDNISRRPSILAVAELVKSRNSAPFDQELISRYQTSLDNELYKAIRALQQAQEWRLKTIESSGKLVKDEA